MTNFKVVHFKNQCISCGACAAISSKFWKMDNEGLADIVGGVKVKDHYELVLESEADRVINQEAADCCPVNIIHVEKMMESGKKK